MKQILVKHKFYYLRYTDYMNDLNLNQIQDLLNWSNSVNSGLPSFDINKLIAWLVVPSIVLTVIFCLWVVANMWHRRRVEKAIFEIRDILREMKLAQQHPIAPAQPQPETAPALQLSDSQIDTIQKRL